MQSHYHNRVIVFCRFDPCHHVTWYPCTRLGMQAHVNIQRSRIRTDHKVLSADADIYAFFAFIAFIAFMAFLGAGAAAAAFFFLLFAIVRSAGEWGKGSLKITFLESHRADHSEMTVQEFPIWQLLQNQNSVCITLSASHRLCNMSDSCSPEPPWAHDEKRLRWASREVHDICIC